FSRRPLEKSSSTRTVSPLARSAAAIEEPMKPAPPVTKKSAMVSPEASPCKAYTLRCVPASRLASRWGRRASRRRERLSHGGARELVELGMDAHGNAGMVVQKRHEEGKTSRPPRERLARMRAAVLRGLKFYKGSLLVLIVAGAAAIAVAWHLQRVYRSE